MAWTNCPSCICRHTPIAFSEVAGKGKDKITFDCVPVEGGDALFRRGRRRHLAPAYAAQAASWRETASVTVYETLERPLVMVLADMERAGITIDPDLLRRLSNDFAKKQGELEKEIHKLAGEDFNIGSPKQLGEILFGKMELAGGRKTKTGAWSTDVDVLEDVAAQGHDIAKKVLDWRGLAKLRGTYTDALPDLHQSQDRPGAHLLCDGVDLHRPARLHRSQSAEHPDPHRGRPPHPPGLHRRQGHAS